MAYKHSVLVRVWYAFLVIQFWFQSKSVKLNLCCFDLICILNKVDSLICVSTYSLPFGFSKLVASFLRLRFVFVSQYNDSDADSDPDSG